MKLKNEFVLRRLADCNVVLFIGKGEADFNSMVTLNDTGAFLWEHLRTDTKTEQLIDALQKEYEIDEETAHRHVEKFIRKLEEAGYLE